MVGGVVFDGAVVDGAVVEDPVGVLGAGPDDVLGAELVLGLGEAGDPDVPLRGAGGGTAARDEEAGAGAGGGHSGSSELRARLRIWLMASSRLPVGSPA